jgi:hypothetical protein
MVNVEEVYMSDEEYEEFLNELYGEVEICGLKYSAGYALRQLDETAFNCGQSETLRFKCGECGKIYEEDEADEADECCKEEEEIKEEVKV